MIKEKAARTALREEINGVLPHDSKGIPIGRVISMDSHEARKVHQLHCTTVAEIKSGV